MLTVRRKWFEGMIEKVFWTIMKDYGAVLSRVLLNCYSALTLTKQTLFELHHMKTYLSGVQPAADKTQISQV